jgi:hypothetical protein
MQLIEPNAAYWPDAYIVAYVGGMTAVQVP